MSENMALTPILSEQFNDTTLDAYYINGEPWYTREQIGLALGYEYPRQAIAKIHDRHKDRLDPLSTVVSLGTVDGKDRDVCVYNLMGVFEICRWSKQPAAHGVMDKLYKTNIRVMEMVHAGELEAAKVWGIEEGKKLGKKQGIREGKKLGIEQCAAEAKDRETRTAELNKNQMKYLTRTEYISALRDIWDSDWERIGLELDRRDIYERREVAITGNGQPGYVFGHGEYSEGYDEAVAEGGTSDEAGC